MSDCVQVLSGLLGTALWTSRPAAPVEVETMATTTMAAVAMLDATTLAPVTLATTTLALAILGTTTMAATIWDDAWMAPVRLVTAAAAESDAL